MEEAKTGRTRCLGGTVQRADGEAQETVQLSATQAQRARGRQKVRGVKKKKLEMTRGPDTVYKANT